MSSPRILAFAGSSRRESFNRKLLAIAVEGARQAGAAVTLINLKDFALPLFDQDLEAASGLPQGVIDLKRLFQSHDGFLIASPEYNGSLTPLLKNAIDWVSRPEPGEPSLGLSAFRGKYAVLMATSPGGLGGLRGLNHLRDILHGLGVCIVPLQKAIPSAHQVFDATGQLVDAKQQAAVQQLGQELTRVLRLVLAEPRDA
jgi:NAD(P)H-dependent FMN reductase